MFYKLPAARVKPKLRFKRSKNKCQARGQICKKKKRKIIRFKNSRNLLVEKENEKGKARINSWDTPPTVDFYSLTRGLGPVLRPYIHVLSINHNVPCGLWDPLKPYFISSKWSGPLSILLQFRLPQTLFNLRLQKALCIVDKRIESEIVLVLTQRICQKSQKLP